MERKINQKTGKPIISSRGGARKGAGRPKGSGHKIRLEDLMTDIETELGMPFSQRLAMNYSLAIHRDDWNQVNIYDRALLNKLVADKAEVEVTSSEDTVAQRQRAFAEAIAKIAINSDSK
jgi:hypothetical protein